jgi:hypothetical protein
LFVNSKNYIFIKNEGYVVSKFNSKKYKTIFPIKNSKDTGNYVFLTSDVIEKSNLNKSKLTLQITESQYKKLLFEFDSNSIGLNWLMNNISNLKVKSIGDNDFYLEGNEPVFYFDKTNKLLWVSRDKIISKFVDDLDIEYSEIISSLKTWVNNVYQLSPKNVFFC